MLWFPLSVERKRFCFCFFFLQEFLVQVVWWLLFMACTAWENSALRFRKREEKTYWIFLLRWKLNTHFYSFIHTTTAASKARLVTNHLLIVREHTQRLFCHGFPRLLIVRCKKYTLIAHRVGHTSLVFPHCLLTPYLGNVFHDIDKAFWSQLVKGIKYLKILCLIY